jgi:hypothetical protein
LRPFIEGPDARACKTRVMSVAVAQAAGCKNEVGSVLCVKFCKGGHGLAGLCGLAEVGFFVLPEIVHVEIAVGFEPVFVGLDG